MITERTFFSVKCDKHDYPVMSIMKTLTKGELWHPRNLDYTIDN